MAIDFQIGPVGPAQRDLVSGMYDRFDPLGESLGLPPPGDEARRRWIEFALGHPMNLAAFSSSGKIVGHCFLVADRSKSAEMAIFVHQHFRRIRIGTALVRSALACACGAGIRRVWGIAASDNRAALRLQLKCGFRLTENVFPEAELEIYLPGGLEPAAG
jgi:GNAT superfamily N-acetyltransferase